MNLGSARRMVIPSAASMTDNLPAGRTLLGAGGAFCGMGEDPTRVSEFQVGQLLCGDDSDRVGALCTYGGRLGEKGSGFRVQGEGVRGKESGVRGQGSGFRS